jgi:hypothetical protein
MKRSTQAGLVACALGVLAAAPAWADDPATALRPLCPDRPTKGTSPCTVDAGHWQAEVDLVDLTHDQAGGARTDLDAFAGLHLRYGINDRLELAATVTPLETLDTHAAGQTSRTSGFGDVVLDAKLALTDPGGKVTAALLPFVKLPTAGHGLGNGAYEGGLVAPIAFSLPAGLSLTLDPEIDVLKDASGPGRHAAFTAAVGVSRNLTATVTGSAELWGQADEDPTGRTRQASFDLALAWIPARRPNLQWDGGVNLGLTRDTPTAQVYAGVTRRF